MHPLHSHQSYMAALAHRLSGVLLALFLPFHFLLLGSALEGADELDRYLRFADSPLVKIAEWGLVSLLCIHLLLGIRVLCLELTHWPHRSEKLRSWILPSVIASMLVGLLFLVRAF